MCSLYLPPLPTKQTETRQLFACVRASGMKTCPSFRPYVNEYIRLYLIFRIWVQEYGRYGEREGDEKKHRREKRKNSFYPLIHSFVPFPTALTTMPTISSRIGIRYGTSPSGKSAPIIDTNPSTKFFAAPVPQRTAHPAKPAATPVRNPLNRPGRSCFPLFPSFRYENAADRLTRKPLFTERASSEINAPHRADH